MLAATIANVASFLFLRWRFAREGAGYRDLWRFPRETFWKDLALAVGGFVLAGPIAMLPMRWLGDETRFARPVRWLVALLGGEVLPVRAFGLEAGRESRGHRFLAPGPVPLRRAADYFGALEAAHVAANHLVRRERLRTQLEQVAGSLGGEVRPDEELLDINTFMVEWPTAFAGSYDARFHDLPDEVIVSALREHQFFFAVQAPGPGGSLLDKFIAVRNGDERGLDVILRGNEGVLAARLEDAEFYWQTDLKRPPADRVEDLARPPAAAGGEDALEPGEAEEIEIGLLHFFLYLFDALVIINIDIHGASIFLIFDRNFLSLKKV